MCIKLCNKICMELGLLWPSRVLAEWPSPRHRLRNKAAWAWGRPMNDCCRRRPHSGSTWWQMNNAKWLRCTGPLGCTYSHAPCDRWPFRALHFQPIHSRSYHWPHHLSETAKRKVNHQHHLVRWRTYHFNKLFKSTTKTNATGLNKCNWNQTKACLTNRPNALPNLVNGENLPK